MSMLLLGSGGVLAGVIAKPSVPVLALLSPITGNPMLSPLSGGILLRAA